MVVEYDGTAFQGWQRQANGPSVQAEIETALERIEGSPCRCTAAGRTDAGVHAEAQLVHADVSEARFKRSPLAYVHGLNQSLPSEVRVLAARAAPAGFHARFSCVGRVYRYQIWNRNTASAIHPWRHWWMPRPLDVAAMQEAAEHLIGTHDFTAFRASGCQAASAVRTLRKIKVHRHGWAIHLHFEADAFLYRMVRNIVGSLVRVGVGDWKPEKIFEILKKRKRALAGATAPPHGLYFVDACYAGFSATSLVEGQVRERHGSMLQNLGGKHCSTWR